MDLVHIGFKVDAKGLKEANNEVDSLLGKVDQIGTKGKKSASEFENSQKKVVKEVDKTSKALERQQIIGDYLGKGLDKTTASAIAGFKQLGATSAQTNSFIESLVNNKGLDQTRKDLEKLSKEQEKQAQAIKTTLAQYEKMSSKSFGGGILDAVEKQNKGVQDLNNYYKQLEAEQAKIAKTQQQAIEKQLNAQKNINAERAKALQIEQLRAKYIAQGFGKTDAGKLASLEVSGASTIDLEKRAEAIRNNSKALSELNPKTVIATETNNKLLDSIKGIAAYALLSTAIYGVITATSSLAVATVQMADEYTAIQNRMKLYIKDANELATVNKQLASFSMENNVGLRETSTLFARLAPSMQRLGKNTEDITTVVDAFGKAMRIGGATAMEAASATIQFSQAMASGKLAGDEFRSISEASPRFLKAIADGSGIAANKLKEMSAAGLLTTEVITNALIKSYGQLSEENRKLGITLEQGGNAIKTAFTVAIGEFNEGAGITRFFGESLMDLALSFKEFSNTAKQSGESFRKWISDNENNIALLGKAAILVSSILIGKLVASFVAVTVNAIKARVATLAMNTSILLMGNTASRSTLLLNGLSASINGVKLAFGGWIGIAATIATTVIGLNAFKESASQANEQLISQSKYVAMTTEELKKLDAQQRSLAQFKLKLDMAEAERNVKAAKEDFLSAFDDVINHPLLAGKLRLKLIQNADNVEFQKNVAGIIEAMGKGNLAFDEGIKKLTELGVYTDSEALALSKLAEDYDKTVDGIKPLIKTMDDLGIKHKVTKDAAYNGKTANDLYKKSLEDVKNSASDATDAVGGLAAKYKQAADAIAGGISVARITGIRDQGLSEELYKEADARAKSLKSTVGVLRNAKAITAEEIVRQGMLDDQVAGAQELLRQQQLASKFYEKDKKSKKEDINNYPEQIRELESIVSLLQRGAGLEVAKIASQKEYVKWYGSNLDVARQIVAIDERRLALEKSIADAKKRDEASKSLKEQISAYAEITKFTKDGFSLSVAQQAVSDGFKYSAEGVAHAQNLVTKSLKDQLATSLDEIKLQQDIFDFVKGGLSVEEATAKATIYRNNHLNKTVLSLAEGLALAKAQVVVEQSRVAYQQEINSLNNQANDLALTQDNSLAEITLKYKGIGIEEAKSLKTKQDIVSKLTEYNELLGKQRTLAYDIENVNFDVFGDFGNPFQSALEGLNSLLFGMDDLKNKYANMYSDLDARIAKEKEGTAAQQALLTQKANLEVMYIEDAKKARDQAITSGLSLTKSLFKEESKGYKIVSGLEKAYQASKIAFALWEKKDAIAMLATKLAGYAQDAVAFVTGIATKTVAQAGLNLVQAQGAVAASANAPPPVGFASAAAMIALMAGIGIAISGGSTSGSFAATNEGVGTVFGDSEAQSASIKNSIELLSDNSDLMLPLTSAMLKSLRNIESSIGGVTNLILRQAISGTNLSVNEGFNQNFIGSFLEKAGNTFFAGIGDFLGINKMLGGLLGGLFGSKTTVKGQGLFGDAQKLGDIITKGFDLVEYIDVQVKKKTFGITTSTKNSTQFAAADEALSKQFSLIFAGFYDSILSATDILGADTNSVKTKLENAIVDIGKIDLKGLNGEQIQEKLEAVFGAAADKLAQQGFAGLDEFQKVGEGYYETLIRVAGAVEQAKYFTDRLNVTAIEYTDILNKQGDVAAEIVRQSVLLNETTKDISGGFYDLVNSFDGTAEELTDFVMTLQDLQDQLFMTGKNADYLTSAMILGAGGIDKLSSGLDAYFEMLSPAEQAAELTRRLTNEFAIFGKELPADVKAFRALVSSIDISTEAGQKLYGQILALAPEFNDLQDALEAANSDINELVNSLRDLAEQARAARGETEVVRNLDYLRNEFNKASELAMQGDVDAANRLLELGSSLMNASKLYSLSSSEYARDLALIQRAATVAADVQESGLGTSISTDLSAPSGTNTTPTLETTDTSATSEISALREEMMAGLYSIAKFVQNLDSRTERWDDGTRVLVGIQPEAGDTPLTVTVTP